MSLIDEALKRAQAMDRVGEDRSPAWTPTHLPDRRPRARRTVGIVAGLLGMAVLALWLWKALPKKEPAVTAPAAAPRPQAAAVPPADASAIPLSETVQVAPPPRGISEPRNSASLPSDRPPVDRRPAKASPLGASDAERAGQPKPSEDPRAASAKRETNGRAEEKLADGRKYTGEIALGDELKITLDGIVYSEENPVALINGMVVAPGQAVDGMTIAKIEPDRVVLEGRGVTVFLLLK